MRKQRTNKLYNFLVNNYDLSKENVMKIFDERVEQLVIKSIGNKMESNYLQNVILNRVTSFIKDGFKDGWYDKNSFENYVKSCIKEVVAEIVLKEYEVKVDIVSKTSIKKSHPTKDK